jgi:hypothetical protein
MKNPPKNARNFYPNQSIWHSLCSANRLIQKGLISVRESGLTMAKGTIWRPDTGQVLPVQAPIRVDFVREVMPKYLSARNLSVASFALFGASTMAIDPIDVLLYNKGPFLLKPQLSVSEVYNDNIFFRNEDKVSDLISILSPGLDLQVGDKDYNYIDLSYTYDRLLYADNSSQDANQHRIGIANYFQHSRLTLSGHDSIDMLSSPIGGGISFRGGKVARVMYFDEYRLAYDLSEKTSPYIDFLNTDSDFEEGLPLYDSRTLRGTAGFEYKAFSKTSFFGEFYVGNTSNHENAPLPFYPSVMMYGAFLGVRGSFTEKLTGSAKAGYEIRTYEDDSPSSGLPVVELDLSEQFSENTTVGLTYTHRQYESVQFTRSAYTGDSITAAVLQQIGNEDRFRANLRATYSSSAYDSNPVYNGERQDNLILAQLTVSYDFKLWLHGFIGYDFEHLDSTTPVVLDYDDNRITVGVTLGY